MRTQLERKQAAPAALHHGTCADGCMKERNSSSISSKKEEEEEAKKSAQAGLNVER